MSKTQLEVQRTPRLLRGVRALLSKGDLPTIEELWIFGAMILAITVLVLNARIIAVPPPRFQGWALLFPAPVWSGTIMMGALAQLYARKRSHLRLRFGAAFWTAVWCGGLCGPLYLRALSFFIPMLVFVVIQAVIAARLLLVIETNQER